MAYFKVKFYDGDYGGVRTELTKTVAYEGEFEDVVAEIENTKSPWGFKYKVHDSPRHGCAVIQRVTKEILIVEDKLEALAIELEELYKELD